MAKKKPKLTPNQLEYQKQLKLLKRRIKSWERKGYEFDIYIPETPERIRKRDIQKLKNIQFKRFSKEEKQLARYRHEEIEERNNTYYEDYNDWYFEPSEEPVSSIAEIDAWLEETFNSIVNPTIVDREREGAKELLRALLDDAKRELGTKAMYEYLQQPKVVDKLNTYASEYISSYQRKNGTDTGSTPLNKFAETLNLGRPLTQEQDEELTMYGSIDFDYTDTDYD